MCVGIHGVYECLHSHISYMLIYICIWLYLVLGNMEICGTADPEKKRSMKTQREQIARN